MFWSKTSTIIIMQVGLWSSKEFLKYIREQVQDFTVGISENMLQYESFFNMNRDSTVTRKILNNENGPETVQFQIKFSELALRNSRSRKSSGI